MNEYKGNWNRIIEAEEIQLSSINYLSSAQDAGEYVILPRLQNLNTQLTIKGVKIWNWNYIEMLYYVIPTLITFYSISCCAAASLRIA